MVDVLEFKVGGKVVYPAHGVGKIVSEEKQVVAGHDLSLYVIDFPKDKMTLRVPVNRAKESGLRILSNDQDVEDAIIVLKGRAKAGRGMWSRRAKEYEDKINSGNITLIAEVVRDLHKNVDDPDRSYSERVIYESALGRLAGEFAAVNDETIEESTEGLIKILKSRKASTTDTSNVTPISSVVSNDEDDDVHGIDLDMDEEFEAA